MKLLPCTCIPFKLTKDSSQVLGDGAPENGCCFWTGALCSAQLVNSCVILYSCLSLSEPVSLEQGYEKLSLGAKMRIKRDHTVKEPSTFLLCSYEAVAWGLTFILCSVCQPTEVTSPGLGAPDVRSHPAVAAVSHGALWHQREKGELRFVLCWLRAGG